MDSKKRQKSVNKVCQKFNVANILEPPADAKDEKRAKERFTLRQHLILNEEHKVLFCFIPKVSCTTMKKIFVVMNGFYPSIEKVHKRKVHRRIIRLDDDKFTEEQRQFMLKDFYKFMIVRDPFERLVSAYRNKFLEKTNAISLAALGTKLINKYRENRKPVETGDDVSFTEYIRHLIDTPSWKLNDHWMPYENLCRPCDVKYDFIGSIDTLERDVAYVIRQIQANETKYYAKQTSSALAKTKEATASFFKKLPQKYFDQLLEIRKTDFELFGYPQPEYETLDKHYHA